MKKIYQYQKEGAELLCTRNYLFDEPGLGKTAQALQYWKDSGKQPALVVCPATLKNNWKEEALQWTGEEALILSGNKRTAGKRARLNIVNYEMMKLVSTTEKFETVFFDEAHYLKTSDSLRTKAAAALNAERKILITGTPILNRPAELFSLLRLTGNEISSNYYQYHTRYCNMHRQKVYCRGGTVRFINNISGASNLAELSERLQPHYIRRRKADVLTQLPHKIRKHIVISRDENRLSLTDENFQSIIDAARRDTIALQEFSRIRIESALKKLPAALDYIENELEQREKVIIFVHHREPAEALKSILEKKYQTVSISGRDTDTQRQKAISDFQNGTARAAVLSIRAAGQGITLTAANLSIFLECDLTPAQNLQCEDRTHRIGQNLSPEYHYLTAENSIDFYIARLLMRKQTITDALF